MDEIKPFNYKKALEYLERYASLGSVLGLDTMGLLMERLHRPDGALKIIHIAGTNGKGSTGAYIASILKSAGFRTGHYSSPAVEEYLEIIRFNGRNVSQKDYAECIYEVSLAADGMERDGFVHPTVFEMQTAAAFLYFKRKECDFVVLECGLGGETDATNVIKSPAACVFTPISLDHMAFLGRTEKAIAKVKAGIIKPDTAVFSSPQKDEVIEVLKGRADRNNAAFTICDYMEDGEIMETRHQTGTYHGEEPFTEFGIPGFGSIKSRMIAAYQKGNIYLALKAAEYVLNKYGNFSCEEMRRRKIFHRGIENVKLFGRFTIIPQDKKHPMVILDGAHNPGAALRLKESMDRYLYSKNIYLVLGMFRDKDTDRVCNILAAEVKAVVTLAPPDNPRAMSSEELSAAVYAYNHNVSSASSVEEAYEMALLLSKADRDAVIVAAGSLSYLAYLKKVVGNTPG